ncbi:MULTISPECIES: hypothetical protein [Pseudosulfitobacter]|nr:hypothetical protein [Pseudosulfitobacter pseudonitzschiae]QKS10147.1 hypothetical protein HT745_17425 [Pseudosulfitobacter pseudonitzschiae]
MRISDMWAVLRQIGLLAISFIGVSAFALLVSLVVFPPPGDTSPIDTFRASETVYATSPRLIYYGRKSLRVPGERVILLGSSNVQVGFDRDAIAERLPQRAVHNLGIGDANVTEIGQIADLALASIGKDDLTGQTFVIGIWYATFIDNQSRWTGAKADSFTTDIDTERFRYGFQKRTETGLSVWISDRDADMAAIIVHPFIALEKGMRALTADLRSLFFVRPPRIDTQTRNTMVFDAGQRADALVYRAHYMKSQDLKGEQYAALEALVQRLTGKGAQVILADLPIPAWHAEGVPYDADHRDRIAQSVTRMQQLARFEYLDMRQLNDNATFYDDAHVRPKSRGPWVDALLQHIPATSDVRLTSISE